MNEGEFSSTEGRTILQGVQGLLNPSSLAAADGTGPPTGGEEADARRNQVADDAAGTIEVVFKKGISVDGSNESDRDQALSEVRFDHGPPRKAHPSSGQQGLVSR